MFTGIVQSLGQIKERKGSFLAVHAPFPYVKKGDSVAVDGVCLTIVSRKGVGKKTLGFDVSAETFSKTTLGGHRPGQKVNLELPVRAGQFFGGHFVQGHVDGTGQILSRTPQDNATTLFEFSVPLRLRKYLAPKGSVSIDGISLTVADLKDHSFTVAVIPETLKKTTLGLKKPNDPINMETDMLAKHLERFLQGWMESGAGEELFIKKNFSWHEKMVEEGNQ